MRYLFLSLSVFLLQTIQAQETLSKLTVDKIMRDPKWMGASPSNPQWSADGKTVYFNWNPNNSPADSLYGLTIGSKQPFKVTTAERMAMLSPGQVTYNVARTAFIYAKNGDVFFTDVKSGKTKQITQTTDMESNPAFSFNETSIVYYRSQNIYAWDIASGETRQLTNFRSGEAAPVAAAREPDTGRPLT